MHRALFRAFRTLPAAARALFRVRRTLRQGPESPRLHPQTLLCLPSGWNRVLVWTSAEAFVDADHFSPVVLAAGGACGAVADGGMSTRRARGGKFPEDISDEGAPQGHLLHRRPRRRGLDRSVRTRTIRQHSSKNRKSAGTAAEVNSNLTMQALKA